MYTPDSEWIDGLPVWLIFASEVSYQKEIKLKSTNQPHGPSTQVLENGENVEPNEPKENYIETSRERERNTLEVKLQNKKRHDQTTFHQNSNILRRLKGKR